MYKNAKQNAFSEPNVAEASWENSESSKTVNWIAFTVPNKSQKNGKAKITQVTL